MAYNGSVTLISGIVQKNNGEFPLVDATAVRIDDNTRLSDLAFNIEIDSKLLNKIIKNTRQEIIYTNGVVTGVRHVSLNGSVIRTDAFNVSSNPMVETRTLSTGEKLTISTDLTTLTSTITYTPASA